MYRIYLLFAMLCISSCRYIYIDFAEEDIVTDNVYIGMELMLETDFVDMKINYDSLVALYSDSIDLRVIIEIHRTGENVSNGNAESFRRFEFFRNVGTCNKCITIDSIAVPQGKYRILLWADYVDSDSHENIYYDASSLSGVRRIYGNYSSGYCLMRDAFSASLDLDLPEVSAAVSGPQYKVTAVMSRPFAVYGIIATDGRESPREPYLSNISYSMYFPVGYNSFYQLPESYQAGIKYESLTSVIDEDDILLASDIVFIGEEPTFYYVNIEVADIDGMRINAVSGKKVSLRKNSITVLKGDFLTGYSSAGGIGINPDFDDEIFIPVQ